MKKCIIILSAFVFSMQLNAQFNKNFEFKYTKAVNFTFQEKYDDALSVFLLLDSLAPGNANINFYIGFCYSNIKKEIQAIPHLKKATINISLDYLGNYFETTAPIQSLLYLAKAYHLTEQLDDEMIALDKYRYYLNSNQIQLIREVDRQIEMCYNAKKFMSNPLKITITNLGSNINTQYPEYSPVIYIGDDTLIFTSRRIGSIGGLKDKYGQFFEDIYFSVYDKFNKTWGPAESIGTNINTSGHEASISISVDRKQLFIYKDDNKDGSIYISKKINNLWSVPEKLDPEINGLKTWETHVCLSPDGNTLYFVSDRSGGFGGTDIWISEKLASGRWGKARNAGAIINTEYNEEAPFISSDNVTLYFSSQGHENMGGFDIFAVTQNQDGQWADLQNMGYPINTTDDDVFYVPTADEKHAYYSSNKLGGYGDQDIYKITILSTKKYIATIVGTVTDSLSGNIVEAKVYIKDIETNEIISSFFTNSKTGEYFATLSSGKDYELVFKAPEFMEYVYKIHIPDTSQNQKIEKKIIMFRTYESLNQKFNFDGKNIIRDEIVVLKNVTFKSNAVAITMNPKSDATLDKLVAFMKANPNIKIMLLGHTDEFGTAYECKKISEERIKIISDYLIAQQIDKSRLSYLFAGSDFPISDSKTEDGKKKNNRIEFKIISW